jgi:Flp pilus assembly protein TadD
VAEREVARRRDVHTLDAYAWALYRSGRFAEARRTLEQVLAVGIREASMLYHAGAIAARLGDRATAVARLRESLGLNPVSEVAAEARRALERLH